VEGKRRRERRKERESARANERRRKIERLTLRPPSEILLLDVDLEYEGDDNSRPDVGLRERRKKSSQRGERKEGRETRFSPWSSKVPK